jgi:hypothetical protein
MFAEVFTGEGFMFMLGQEDLTEQGLLIPQKPLFSFGAQDMG